MNIFYLDPDPEKAAQYLCNKHVVKMILESAQMLSTAHWCVEATKRDLTCDRAGWWSILSQNADLPVEALKSEYKTLKNAQALAPRTLQNIYSPTHVNHPSNIWVRTSALHYNWLTNHALAMCVEYTRRYNKRHKTQAVLEHLHDNIPRELYFDLSFQQPPQCMPDDVKVPNSSVVAYRSYYKKYKAKFAKWPDDRVPDWWPKY